MDTEKKVLTPADVAKAMGVNRKTIYNELKKGSIPSVRCGDKFLIPIAAFNKYLEGNQASKVS